MYVSIQAMWRVLLISSHQSSPKLARYQGYHVIPSTPRKNHQPGVLLAILLINCYFNLLDFFFLLCWLQCFVFFFQKQSQNGRILIFRLHRRLMGSDQTKRCCLVPITVAFYLLVGCGVSPPLMQNGSSLTPGTGESPEMCWQPNSRVHPLCHCRGSKRLPWFPGVHLAGNVGSCRIPP